MNNELVLYEMQCKGFNVTTCGNCGFIKLQNDLAIEELTCEYCDYTDDVSNFPDLVVTNNNELSN